jgi:zinc protease
MSTSNFTHGALLVSFLCWFGLGVAVAGQQSPPPGGEPRDLVLAEPVRGTLDNGLAFALIQFGQAPKATVMARVRTGALDEEGRTWLASLTGDMMKEATENYSSARLAEAAAAMGGALEVNSGPEFTTVTIDVLGEFAGDAVALLAELLRRPTFPATEFERVQRDYQRRLAVQRSQPQAQAQEAFLRQLYGDHPFAATFPEPQQLAGYTIEDVRGFHAANFGAARTTFYVAGRFDAGSVEHALRQHFGDWPAGPAPRIDVPPPGESASVVLMERPGAPQSTLQLGLRTIDPSHPDWTRLMLTNTLLGGYFSSRITANIREDKGYTYSPFSWLSPRYRDAYWGQRADVTAEHTAASLREIYAELDLLRAAAPGAAELARVQNYMIGIFTISNASRGGILGQFAFIDAHGLPPEYVTGYVERIEAITAEQVSATARSYLVPERMSLAIVGDLELVRPQLEALPQVQGRLQ